MSGETKQRDTFVATAKSLLQEHIGKVRKKEVELERKNGVDPSGKLEENDLFVLVKSFFTAASSDYEKLHMEPSMTRKLAIKQRVAILDLLSRFKVYEQGKGLHPMNIIEEVQNDYQFYRDSLGIEAKKDEFDDLLEALHRKAVEHYNIPSGTINELRF